MHFIYLLFSSHWWYWRLWKGIEKTKTFLYSFCLLPFSPVHTYIYIFFLFFSYSKKPNGWSSSMQWSQGNACNLCTFNSADQWDNWSCTYITLTPSFELQKKNGLSPSLDMLIQETRLSQIRGNLVGNPNQRLQSGILKYHWTSDCRGSMDLLCISFLI